MNLKDIFSVLNKVLGVHSGRISILFCVCNNISWDVVKPVYIELKLHEKKRNISLATTLLRGASVNKSDKIFYESYIPRKIARLLKWHYTIHTDVHSQRFLRRNIKLMFTHGVGFGNAAINYNAIMFKSNNCDIYFGLSENERLSIFSECKDLDDINYIKIGSPKTDALFNNDSIDKELYDKYNNKKLLLITSHWTEHSVLRDLTIKNIERLAKKYSEKIAIAIVGHGRLWDVIDKNKFYYKRLISLADENDNLDFYPYFTESCLHDLIKAADFFLVDNSSIAIECATQGRTMLFYDHKDWKFFSNDIHELYKKVGHVLTNMRELDSMIEGFLEGDIKPRPDMNKFIDYFIANKGKSAKTAAEIILNFKTAPFLKCSKLNKER